MNGVVLSGRGWLLLLVAGISTTFACGNTRDDTPGDPSHAGPAASERPQTLAEFEQYFAESYCQNIAACCSGQGFATTDCSTTLREQLRAQFQSYATNQKIHLNPDAGAACIDAYAKANYACSDHSSFAAIDRACERVFEGTAPLGGECGRDVECAPQAPGSVACSAGVCVRATSPSSALSAPHRQLGEACASSCESSGRDESCGGSANDVDPTLGSCWLEDGLLCVSGVCVRAPQVGEACASFGYCASEAHCVDGLCAANQSSGPCTQDRDCLSSAFCNFTLKMCEPLKANAEPCEVSEECQGAQCYEHHCRTWSVAAPHTCLGLLDD